MRRRWFEFFREWDVLICPPLGTVATLHDHSERWQQKITVNGKEMYQVDQMFWVGYSGVASLPSTVAPLALSAEGLPIGVQIVAAQYGDYTSMRFAALLEREYKAFVPPPGYE
jgi:amidase